MSEINVTAVANEAIEMLSGSQAELGSDAARITWRNCLECAERFGDELEMDLGDVRDHFAAYGAWERADMETWPPLTLRALVIQEAAACMREREEEGFSEEDDGGRLWEDGEGRFWLYIGM